MLHNAAFSALKKKKRGTGMKISVISLQIVTAARYGNFGNLSGLKTFSLKKFDFKSIGHSNIKILH